MVLEKTLESSLNNKEIKPVNPKGNQSWIFIRRTHAETEAPVLWPCDTKRRLTNQEKPWCWESLKTEKGMTENEVVGWHHRLDGHEFEHVPGVGDGHWCLVCFSPWGCKESDTTELLNWNYVSSNTAGIAYNTLNPYEASWKVQQKERGRSL